MTRIAREIRQDIAAAQARDPATRGLGKLEVLVTYNGVHALLLHRIAHALDERGLPLLPRLIAYFSRVMTGVEIHPKALIGENFFIDHGTGVVIGETAQIGDNVTIYQGVTLGGTGLEPGKRHPTIEDNVTVGSGAKLLGPIRIGHGAKIGANSVVIHDVPPATTVVGNPGHPVRVHGEKLEEGPDTDWIHLPDPVADALTSLSDRLREAEQTIAELRGEDPPGHNVTPLRRSKGHDPTGG